SERVEAVSLALSNMGIEVAVSDIWGGFDIQNVQDHPDYDNTIFVRNRKLDMIVKCNEVKSVIDAIIKSSQVEWPVGDYKSLCKVERFFYRV
ncbi:hypothetical protein A2U01_0039138, partial [Trifolium medium]|nr:hypothetical protein [Trifolium medium]